ncbi:MAG: YeeE/YedE family protein [Alphaproteobacteria bacterium]|nr:YeeE/YedE family protein [Alphaproteobacteria bacterium]
MSVLNAVILGLAMGAAFGIALEKSRVFEPGIIVGQMRLTNFLMLRIFLTAVAVGAVVLAVLTSYAGVKLVPKATLYAADILGGVILGIGIAMAGACPGTVLAQVGAGYRDAWFTLGGGLVGALAFSYLEPSLKPHLFVDGPGKLTFDRLLDVGYAPVALGFAATLALALYGLEAWRPWRQELGPEADGRTEPPVAPAAPAVAA